MNLKKMCMMCMVLSANILGNPEATSRDDAIFLGESLLKS